MARPTKVLVKEAKSGREINVRVLQVQPYNRTAMQDILFVLMVVVRVDLLLIGHPGVGEGAPQVWEG